MTSSSRSYLASLPRRVTLVLLLLIPLSCEKPLEEEVFSELTPGTLLSTEGGITSVLNSAYASAHRSGAVATWAPYHTGGMPSGEIWGAGGSIESLWVTLINFTWDSNHDHFLTMWTTYYNSLRDANIILDALDGEGLDEDFRQQTRAQINFLRGWCYAELYNLFGPVPLYTSRSDDPLQPRPSDSEMRAFIEEELLAAIAGLTSEPLERGRADKGAALGVLSKYYLNTRQWEEAAATTEELIALGNYGLVEEYADVFAIANEGNREGIWVLPKTSISGSASFPVDALVFPPDFPRPFPNNGVFAARTYLYDSFVTSFAEEDERAELIVTEYTSTSTGEVVVGLGNDQSFPYKYEFDPNAVGANGGNDVLAVRYADILLSRAEALNEISGPSQEAIDLINEVRERAGVTGLSLSDYDQASLRAAILRERAWEFWFEAKRREDLLRHDKFLSQARERGITAEDYRALFPIPQIELDANGLLEQNAGY